ncbi:helix-turn-helix transcriptional regulator [Neotabrizicola shimadae]|uniref:Autoinducer binding domain-containing protein n=1 Tax=Neotabrizicola shimadae TaxID=2807096 RepID=A0A8G0ZYJ8_9RHOB|nr:LuxR family transcriptional regulator [Neotabrizicola shimadae]QYZ71213.1 autoinducer binding domain-containing protein [Neotabrizicola shimadae]
MTRVLPLLTQIAEARSADAVWSLASAHFASLGFSRAIYGLARGQRANHWPDPANRLFLSTLGPEFIRTYLESGSFTRTALYRWAESNEGACTWSWIPAAVAAGEILPHEVEALQQDREMGIVAGITVAFPRFHARTKAALGLMADVGMTHEQVDDIWASEKSQILAVAHMMHLCLLQYPAMSTLHRLTQRQREALEWVADGKTTQDVALIMGVSPAMVEKHLRLAREALDVDTTAQAIARAVALNLLFPVRNTGQTYTKEVGNP